MASASASSSDPTRVTVTKGRKSSSRSSGWPWGRRQLRIDGVPVGRLLGDALWSAERVVGREGRVAEPLPHDDVVALLRAHQRL